MIENVLKPIVNQKTSVMIVGSMPGKQSLEKQQYYGNPRNHFWPIIGELLNVEIPENYEARITLLQAYQIGLWDSIAYCEREGSLDAKIKNEIPNDFETLFKLYPQVTCILFNGGKSLQVFKKHIGMTLLEDKVFYQLPSTSPIPGKNIKSFAEKVATWQILKKYINL